MSTLDRIRGRDASATAATSCWMNLSFAIPEGEFFGIVGANGSGKTTILRAMLGILAPHARPHRVRGRRPAHALRLRSATRRSRRAVPAHRARDRADGALRPASARPAAARDAITTSREHQLEHVGLGGLSSKRFRDMSGGQKQRTLFARALARRSTGAADGRAHRRHGSRRPAGDPRSHRPAARRERRHRSST